MLSVSPLRKADDMLKVVGADRGRKPSCRPANESSFPRPAHPRGSRELKRKSGSAARLWCSENKLEYEFVPERQSYQPA
jgi:hypothetical protein